ncbi:hypothetical protein ACFWQC_25905 [Nocardioides sp. NPDC058538]|uniref:hypothetical protein n=1 Tax=Nocardioides sp. NPDC058538 TaxID=3346542 RepID=UPI00365C929E
MTSPPQPQEPHVNASEDEWHTYFWDRAEADTASTDGNTWASALIPLLRTDSELGRLYPTFSMWVLRLGTNRPGRGNGSVGGARRGIGSDSLMVYAPAANEIFDPYGGFTPWQTALSPSDAVRILREGVATRDTRRVPAYIWSASDASGPILDLIVDHLDYPGLVGTVNVRRPHALAKAIADAAVTPLARPTLADIPETWPKVPAHVLERVQVVGHRGHTIDTLEIRAHGAAVWWTTTPDD